jgi:hypothetical protein
MSQNQPVSIRLATAAPQWLGDAQAFCRRTIEGFAAKAAHNKRESQTCFMVVVLCTAVVPLFITLGEGFWWGKAIPAALSTLAAIATAWLQLRKPQQLWTLYRSAQRELEDQETKRQFLIDEYATDPDPDKLLASKVAVIALNAHHQWVPMVPNPDHLKISTERSAPPIASRHRQWNKTTKLARLCYRPSTVLSSSSALAGARMRKTIFFALGTQRMERFPWFASRAPATPQRSSGV